MSDKLIVRDDGGVALMDTAKFEHMQRVAKAMALAPLMPDHLRIGKNKQPLSDHEAAANCLLVVNQAIRWNMDPFAVAPETYVVSGKLGFQGKLVAAVVNTRSGLNGRLKCTFSGSGPKRTITVIGQFADEDEPRTVELSVEQAKTDNKMWTTDPDQKLWYSGVTKWARRHCPEVMLGVLTDDDVERMAEIQAGQHAAPPASLDDLTRRLTQSTEPVAVEQAADIAGFEEVPVDGQLFATEPSPGERAIAH